MTFWTSYLYFPKIIHFYLYHWLVHPAEKGHPLASVNLRNPAPHPKSGQFRSKLKGFKRGLRGKKKKKRYQSAFCTHCITTFFGCYGMHWTVLAFSVIYHQPRSKVMVSLGIMPNLYSIILLETMMAIWLFLQDNFAINLRCLGLDTLGFHKYT